MPRALWARHPQLDGSVSPTGLGRSVGQCQTGTTHHGETKRRTIEGVTRMNVSQARAAVAGAIVAVALWGCVAMSAAPVANGGEDISPVAIVTDNSGASPAPVATPAETVAPVVSVEDVDSVGRGVAPDAVELPHVVTEPPAFVPPASGVTLPPCEAEDSTECYWDARTRGNGEGRSFVNIGGTVYYLGTEAVGR